MFNNLTNKEKEALVKAILIGVANAVVIPLILFTLVNLKIDGNYGGVASIVYIIIMAFFYNIVFSNSDISKMAFNYTVGMVYGLLLGILLIGFILAAV